MRSLIGVLALTIVPALAAQNVDIPFEKFVLPNGLTVLVHEDHKAPIVAVNVWYHVGSKNEKPGKTGFAHLFEHLMFGGSENVKGRYIEAMEKIGATDLNGTTSEDRTNYFENVPSSAVDYALFAESDRMGHFFSTINKETLDLQRGVVQNEKRQDENQPYAVSEELIQKATYPAAHPYSHTVIGSMDDLNAASLDDVKEWFKTYYGPSNAVLVIAGDIDVKTAKEKVTKYFGDIPPGPPVAHPQSWVAKMSGEHRETVQDRVPQARLYKVWNVPEFGTATSSYLQLVARILGTGKSTRLYKRLVYDDQIATNVQVFVDEKEISSQFYIIATAKPSQDLKAVEAAVNEELARFLKDGPTPAELDRARTQYEANFIRGIERIGGFGGKSDILATNQTYLGNAAAYKDALKAISSATTGNVKDAADSWLSDGVYNLEVLPFTPQLTTEKGADRSKLPELGAAPELKLPKLQKDTLSNGLKIVLAERHEIPIVDFWLTVDAGFASDHGTLPGTASLASALLTGGTTKRDALQISDELQSLGAQLRATSDLDFTTVFFSALKAKLDPSLELLADVALNPSFPQTDFGRQQKIQLATIGQEKSQPFGMALRVMPPLLYGVDNAYGVPFTGSGTTTSVAKITREDLVKFHQAWFKPNNTTLIIVGDTTLAEIKPKLEQYFGAWKSGTVPVKEVKPVSRPTQPVVFLIDKPGALQSIILTGTVAPAPVAGIEPTYETMNAIYGGSFGSRLNMNLREDKHWSYGAGSILFDARHQRPYLAYAPVQTDKTKESLIEIQKELSGIAGSKPITEAELQKAQSQEVLELPGSRETMQSVGNSVRDLLKFNFPDDYYQTYVKKVESLRTADVNDAAKSLISPQNTVWVIVGDRAKIEQGVRDLNIGEVKLIDADGNPSKPSEP
jgi:zinc protease